MIDRDTYKTLAASACDQRIRHYIDHLATDSPVVSTSHLTLRQLYADHGQDVIDVALRQYWETLRQLDKMMVAP